MKNSGKKIFKSPVICSILILACTFYYNSFCLSASPGNQNKYQFAKPTLTFDKYKGLDFRISEPFLSGTEPGFTIALELKNNSDNDLTKLTFRIKLYDKQGKVISESINNCGPLTFLPASGKTIPRGYTGVYERFCTKDKSLMDTFGKIEIELIEIEVAPKDLYDKPVFDSEWRSFEGYKRLQFRISQPYKYLDELSGNTLFAIALEFRNNSIKAVKFLNFNQKVYDSEGLLVDREIQNHNQMYEPFDFKDDKFPEGYTGINMKFYATDLDFFKKFRKIEYQLISVEY